MPLLNDGKVVTDPWTTLGDEDALPETGAVIVSLERWTAERDSLAGRNDPIGIRLKPDQMLDDIARDLTHFALVALEFPAFSDGRAYSKARLLRDRHGFAGEVRAVGDVLRDQFSFLERCGFDSLETRKHESEASYREAADAIPYVYQPAADTRRTVQSLRERRLAGRG